jgi:16S rRNA (guanine966-N2)-methyltransferase
MRIISGEFRRRNLHTPPDASTTRPIPDRVKESLFSILRGHTEGATVLDAFAGCGAIGLEAVSRGAKQCVFVEMDKKAAELIRKNIDMLGCGNRCTIVQGDALGVSTLARVPRPLKLAFFDPPYPIMRDPLGYQRTIAQMSSVIKLLSPDGYAVLRTPWPLEIPQEEGSDPAVAQSHKPKNPRAAEREELRKQLREAKAVEGAAPTERVGGGAGKAPRKSGPLASHSPTDAGSNGPTNAPGDEGTPLAELLSKALGKKNPLMPQDDDESDINTEDFEASLDTLSTQKQREAWLKKQLGEDAEFADDEGEDDDLAEDLADDFDDASPDVIDDEADVEVVERELSPEELEAELAGDDDDLPQAPRVLRPDLAIPGALGPETHIYGTMAVHLYMRDPNAK